jgi:hypothetical protein
MTLFERTDRKMGLMNTLDAIACVATRMASRKKLYCLHVWRVGFNRQQSVNWKQMAIQGTSSESVKNRIAEPEIPLKNPK